MPRNILLVDKKHKCLKNKGKIILTPEQNNIVMAYAKTIAKHTELEYTFILGEVYEAIGIFTKNHILPCYASYNDVDISIRLQIIKKTAEILFARLKPLVNEKELDFAMNQALNTIVILYMEI